MSITSDFTFNNMGRIGFDAADQSQRTIQNVGAANYMLMNLWDGADGGAMGFSLNQPDVYFQSRATVTAAVVDDESMLRIDRETLKPAGPQELWCRPFLTVPYLGRGSCDPDVEQQMKLGDPAVVNKKTEIGMSEKVNTSVAEYPMMDDLRARAGATQYMIQEEAMNGWVRGGTQTRKMN